MGISKKKKTTKVQISGPLSCLHAYLWTSNFMEMPIHFYSIMKHFLEPFVIEETIPF